MTEVKTHRLFSRYSSTCLPKKIKGFLKKISTLKIATGHQWRKVFVTVKHSKKNPVIFIRSRKTAGVEKNEFYSRFYQVID